MILAIDPGKMTGLAWVGPTGHYGHEEVPEADVWKLVDFVGPTIIVMERFTYRPLQAADLSAVKVIGIVEEWVRQHRVEVGTNATRVIVFQYPHQAKHFYTDDRLRSESHWIKGKPHARDAVRHLLYFQRFGQRTTQTGAPTRKDA